VSNQFREGKLALPECSADSGEELQRPRGLSVSSCEPSLTGSVDFTGPHSSNPNPATLKPLQQLAAWMVTFNNQTLGDRVRLVVCVCFCLFLLLRFDTVRLPCKPNPAVCSCCYSQFRWDRAVSRLQKLEARTAQLEKLVESFLVHMETALQQQLQHPPGDV